MTQSRFQSLIEAGTNTVVGFVGALAIQVVAFPAFGLTASTVDHVGLALLFTAVSVLRSYLLRRLFERHRPPSPSEFGYGETD